MILDYFTDIYFHDHQVLSQRQILGTGNLPQDSAPFVLILISLQRWQHRVRNEIKHFVSPHLIGPQFLANQHETNQHESAVDWSISRDLLGTAICGELPKLLETDAERSTGVPLLSAAESRSSG